MRTILFLFLVLFSPIASAYDPEDFQNWLMKAEKEAVSQGISPQLAATAFQTITFLPKVIELDQKQPEGKMTFAKYRNNVISDFRVNKGRRLFQKHSALLDEISSEYGVQPQYIVALWGIETSYGGYTGGFDTIDALATLAYEGRRGAFFKKELMNALKIVDQGHVSLDGIKGSWAGALGQNQFMPSSFHQYAVDGNGDGKRDIWNSLEDVFASTANYLAQNGWKGDEKWGRSVKLPAGFSAEMVGLKIKKPISEWQDLGVRRLNGEHLPVADLVASIVAPDGLGGPAFMVYDNYRTIMRWNRSTYFATSVGLLADAIRAQGRS